MTELLMSDNIMIDFKAVMVILRSFFGWQLAALLQALY